mmetsp:Transcript_100028/g.173599  ORF Transcript_100028/g.173599 Transcript_100028/m.173599 type:complete len:488 (-) Transcript_100028:54-1517(-)
MGADSTARSMRKKASRKKGSVEAKSTVEAASSKAEASPPPQDNSESERFEEAIEQVEPKVTAEETFNPPPRDGATKEAGMDKTQWFNLDDEKEAEREEDERFEEAEEQAEEPDLLAEEADAVSAAEELTDDKVAEPDLVSATEELVDDKDDDPQEKVKVEPLPLDPALAPPGATRQDWSADMAKLRELVEDPNVPDTDKIQVLHEALTQRIEDTKTLEEHKASTLRRLDDSGKERDRCRRETERALATNSKLEGSCRELQTQKSNIAKENQRIAEEEQSRHTELKEKFEQAIKDVQEKMDAELEVRQHFMKENEDLRGKLQKFTETYEAQERQLAEQRESRASEMEVAQKRLQEHETACSESKANTAVLEKQNEALKQSQKKLRAELQSILGKFDEFHEAVTGSNQRHGECKVEIDNLQSRLQDLEKENADLRNSAEVNNAAEEQKVAQKQRDALEKLCDNLQRENKKLQEQLESLKKRQAQRKSKT